MNIFKRAWIYNIKNIGKSAILLTVIFLVGTLIAGAISVERAVMNMDESLRIRLRPIISVSFDDDAYSESDRELDMFSEDWPNFTANHARALAELPQIEFYDYMTRSGVMSTTLYNYIPQLLEDSSGLRSIDPVQHYTLRGTGSTSMVPINQGLIELTLGRQFVEAELHAVSEVIPVIVSHGFAFTNDLLLDSIFEMYRIIQAPHNPHELMIFNENWHLEQYHAGKFVYTFQIIGLFDLTEEITEDNAFLDGNAHRFLNDLNSFYVPNWAAEKIELQYQEAFLIAWENSDYNLEDSEQLAGVFWGRVRSNNHVDSIFVIDDLRNLEAFRLAASEVLPDYHKIVDLSHTIGSISTSMDAIQGVASGVLMSTIIASILIISLLTILFFRDRRHEIGVYLAMGDKRIKIISQMLIEVVAIFLVGTTLALFAGNIIAENMSAEMLRTELIREREMEAESYRLVGNSRHFSVFGIPQNEFTVDEMIEAFEITYTPQTMLIIYGIGLVVVTFSTIIPIWMVVKLSPKEVLL